MKKTKYEKSDQANKKVILRYQKQNKGHKNRRAVISYLGVLPFCRPSLFYINNAECIKIG